jgi:hypothetical protein
MLTQEVARVMFMDYGLMDAQTWYLQWQRMDNTREAIYWIRHEEDMASILASDAISMPDTTKELEELQALIWQRLDKIKDESVSTTIKQAKEIQDGLETMASIQNNQHNEMKSVLTRDLTILLAENQKAINESSSRLVNVVNDLESNITDRVNRKVEELFTTMLNKLSQSVIPIPQLPNLKDNIKTDSVSSQIKQEEIEHSPNNTFNRAIGISSNQTNEPVNDSAMILNDIKLLSNLKFKELDDAIMIQSHIQVIENQLENVGLLRNGMLRVHLQNDLCNKFYDSLKNEPNCYKTAKMIGQERNANWINLKSELIRRIASKDKQREVVDKRISELTFPGWQQINDYIERGTRLFMMIRNVYGDNEESRVRELVNIFIKRIPNDTLIREIIQTIRRSGNDHTDWELKLPFADVGINANTSPIIDISGEIPTICSIIQEVVQVYLVSKQERQDKQDKQERQDKQKQLEIQKWIIYNLGDKNEEHWTKKLQELGSINIKPLTSRDGRKRILFESGRGLADLKEKLEGSRVGIFKNFSKNPEKVNYAKSQDKQGETALKRYSEKQLSIKEEDDYQELILEVSLQLGGFYDDQLKLNATVDTGAGRSYLIVPKESLARLPSKSTSREISFADGSTSEISQYIGAKITIQSLMTDKIYQQDCMLYIIPQEEGEMQLLLGRDLVSKFNMVIHTINYISIDDTIIYERETGVESAVRNTVYLTRGQIMEPNQTIQKEYKEDLIQFEDQDDIKDIDVGKTKEQEIQIQLRTSVDAPFGRPVLKIPWNSEERPPTNFKEAFIRDKKTSSKLTTEEKKLYQEAVEQLLINGHAKRIEKNSGLTGHYIAVRPVFKTDRKTTKCRLCLDARILNKYTHTGTIVSDNIISNLLEFRSHYRIAVFDLAKAFWQVEVEQADQQFFPTVILGERLQFNKIIFGGTFSPSALEVALRKIKEKAFAHLSHGLIAEDEPTRPRKLSYINYVDDFLVYEDDDENLIKQVTWLRWYLNQHGFPSDKVYFSGKDDINSTYLGYRWNVQEDLIQTKAYTREISQSNAVLNRRDVTSLILALYDPLGLHLRLQLAGRQLLRQICSESRNQDQSNPWKFPVEDKYKQALENWMQAARNASEHIPRYATITEKMFIFADSSSKAWVVEVYNQHFELIMAKGGLLPVTATIPRGELLAVYQAIWLLERHFESFKSKGMKQLTCFTDNEPNLHRLRNVNLDRHLPIYERNRVQQIRKLIKQFKFPVRIQHIPGVLNLADYATRFDDLSLKRPSLDVEAILKEINKHDAYFHPEIDQDERLLRVMLRSDTKREAMKKQSESQLYSQSNSNAISTPQETDRIKDEIRSEERQDIPPELIPITVEEVTVDEFNSDSPQKNLIEKIKVNQLSLDAELISKLRLSDGLFMDNNNKVYINNSDRELILELIKMAHEPHHNGIHRTKYELHQFYWKNKLQDVTRFVSECQICSQTRQHKVKVLSVGKTPWDKVARLFGIAGVVGIDICQGVDAGTHLLTIVCAISKWIRAAAITSQTSTEVIEKLRGLFETSVFPKVIISDGGPCFKSKEFGLFCNLHGVIQLVGPSYASAYNGWFERPHQTVLAQLRLLRADEPTVPWEMLLPTALHLVNSRPYNSNDKEDGVSPIQIVYGNSKIRSGILHEVIDSEALSELKESGIDHLLRTIPENLLEIVEAMSDKRRAALEGYLEIFEKKRTKIQERLRDEMSDPIYTEDYIPVGSWVRSYKPSSGKLTSNFSLPQEVIGKPSEATRQVKAIDGKVQLEYLGNLVPYNKTSAN